MSTLKAPGLRIHRPDNPAAALGLAVNHLMTKPAFANLRFGDWSRILVGQINRRHYLFVLDGKGEVQGFMGWALASAAHAEAWAEGRRALSFDDSTDGDCMVINAWAANSTRVTRFMVAEARRIARDKTAIHFKRHYKSGTARAARVPINDFVKRHIGRSGDSHAAAMAG